MVVKKVSVILVNYNSMPHIDVCIQSILRQSYENYEIIFVDNNSSDGSMEYARRKYPQLIFVANDNNLGYAGGINSGLAHAKGEYISPLNVDTEVSTDLLEIMTDFLYKHPDSGAVMPKILLYYDRQRVNTLGSDIHITGLSFCRGLNEIDDNSTRTFRVSGVSGCSYLIRREILERLGGIPEESSMGNDDVIISWLVNLMGWEIYCIPEAVVYHKYKLKMNPEKLFQLEKGRQTLLLYSLKPLTVVACFPIFAITEILILGYCLLKGRRYTAAKFRVVRELYRDRKYIKERRVQVQKLRRISDFELFKKLKWNLKWRQLFHTLTR